MTWIMVIGGIPMVLNMVLPFMIRTEGASREASTGIILGSLTNIVLDPLFILPWGFGLEATGAAIATVISSIVSTVYFMVFIIRSNKINIISFHIQDALPDKETLRNVMISGLPSSLQTMMGTVSNTVLNVLTVKSAQVVFPGAVSAVVAAMGITKKIDMLPMHISIGMAQGVLPLTAYNYSAKNYKRMKSVQIFALTVAMSLAFTCIVFFLLFAKQLVGLFITDEQTIKFGTRFLRIMCISTPFMGIVYILTSAFQAVGKGKQSLLLALTRKGPVDISLMFLLNAIFPLIGLLFVQPIVDMASSVISIFAYRRMIASLKKRGD